MTFQEIYELAISMGITADPRGEKKVRKFLEKTKKEYEEMSEKQRKYFDKETFKNPYSDTRILYGNSKTEVKKVMAGIDADASEVLLVDRLNQKGEKIDVLISHHPSGHALASLHDVMAVQADMFADAGVPINVAYSLLQERQSHIQRAILPLNHTQTTDTARILEVPLLAIHTVWDNLGNKYVEDYLRKMEFDTAGEVIDAVNEIPEFIEAIKGKAGPMLVSGTPKSPAGKVVVEFTGGTSPSKEMYTELAKAGVGTLVVMHIPDEGRKELIKHHVNIIDVGHMAADSIGANLYLDELEKRGVKVIPCSGLVRIKRNK